MLQQGEIVLIPIPFTDLSSQKRRPVIVVSSEEYHRKSPDMVVVAMTSNPGAATEYGFTITSSDLVRGRLNRPGIVRVDRIYTLSQTLTTAVFGKVSAATLDRIRAVLQDLVATHP